MTQVNEQRVGLEFNGEQLEGVLVGVGDGARRPTVIMVPTVLGVSDFEIGHGRDLVGKGYTAFVVDLFGKKFHGAERDVMFGEMQRLLGDRASLRDRITKVVEQVRGLDGVDPARIVAIGFCFGGLCVLDLARSGADIAGVAAFHGLFKPPGLDPQPIRAKVVAYHGWDDPMVPPEDVVALAAELTAAGADWQIHAYGNTQHGFTMPRADSFGVPGVSYEARAARRSFAALDDFLGELFG